MKAAPLVPLMAAIGVMGAVQAAVVAAQPIPKYAKGTEDHPGGLAEVGHGRPEAIILPSGQVVKTSATPSIVDLPKHTIVKPDYRMFVEDQARELIRLKDMQDFKEIRDFGELNESIKQVERTIRRQKPPVQNVSLGLDKTALWYITDSERNKVTYINQRLHRKIQS